MERLAERRKMLLAAGTAAVTVVAGAVAAQSTDIQGTIEFEGGAAIPKGHIEISITDPAMRDNVQHEALTTRLESHGDSRIIGFSLSLPSSAVVLQRANIVARLERADGWLLARGGAKVDAESPVQITLYTAMY